MRSARLGGRSLLGLPGLLLLPRLLGIGQLERALFPDSCVLALAGPLLLTLRPAGRSSWPLHCCCCRRRRRPTAALLRPLLALVLAAPLLLAFGAPRLRRLDALALGGPGLLGRLLRLLGVLLRLGIAGGPGLLLALVPALLLRPLLLLALSRRVTTGSAGRTGRGAIAAVLALALVVLTVLTLLALRLAVATLLAVRRLLAVLLLAVRRLALGRELTLLRRADRRRQCLVGLEDVETGGAVQRQAGEGVEEARRP